MATPIRPRCSGLRFGRPAALLAGSLFLGGCATTAIEDNFQALAGYSQERLGTEVQWVRSEEERARVQARVDAWLQEPLDADTAVRIALSASPAFQALLADAAAASAAATQSARPANPVFAFEHLVKSEAGHTDLDIGRALAVSLLDLLLLPARLERAEYRQQQLRARTAAEVVQRVNTVRAAWTEAVAAAQQARYAEEVKVTAEAGAELARRMQAVGNFSRLQRAKEQSFYADAAADLARTRHQAAVSRERLVRQLGLSDAQAAALRLPPRLPDLPAAPRTEALLAQQALEERLDVRMARAELDWTARDLGLTQVTSVVNGLHGAFIENRETGEPAQRGYELELPLPVFDFGDARRADARARYLAAMNRTGQVALEATSRVREAYADYRTAYDLARHYRDEVMPLKRHMAEEMLLQYNGMLIGVFDLLEGARSQVAGVLQAIEAERDFWLADAALQAALLGTPTTGLVLAAPAAAAAPAGGGH